MTRIEPRPQLLRRIPAGRVELTSSHRQRRLPPHHLHRLRQTLPDHRRAQDVVAVDHRLQRRQEAVEPVRLSKASRLDSR